MCKADTALRFHIDFTVQEKQVPGKTCSRLVTLGVIRSLLRGIMTVKEEEVVAIAVGGLLGVFANSTGTSVSVYTVYNYS